MLQMWNSKQAHLSFYISVEQEDEKLVWILKTLSSEEEFIAISKFWDEFGEILP
jgi:hypothetical protein